MPKTTKRRRQPRKKQAPVAVQPPARTGSPDLELIREVEEAVNRSEVNELTERIFGSALSRHGWSRNRQGQIEHIGDEHAA